MNILPDRKKDLRERNTCWIKDLLLKVDLKSRYFSQKFTVMSNISYETKILARDLKVSQDSLLGGETP